MDLETIDARRDDFYLPYLRRYHVRWWNKIKVGKKAAQDSEIIKRNRAVLDKSISYEIQTENLLNLKGNSSRGYILKHLLKRL